MTLVRKCEFRCQSLFKPTYDALIVAVQARGAGLHEPFLDLLSDLSDLPTRISSDQAFAYSQAP